MDLAVTVAEIARLPVDQRILLVHAILDTIVDEDTVSELTDEQKQTLDRRIADLDANPNNVLTWEQIKAHIKVQS